MNPNRRTVTAALALAALGAPLFTRAQAISPGRDYTVLKPEQPVEAPPGKIEVLEFFWYGCIHCYHLEPFIETWLKKLPADALFRRVPAVFNERWGLDAGIFYALEALGLLEKLHRPLFDAIHRERLRTDSADALHQWLRGKGVDTQKFDQARRSFGVESRVKRAAQMTGAYRIDGTPAMAVHGRYTVSAEQARNQDGMLATVDRLVDLVRRAPERR
jgi:thiol:disulfide interchange protein DsbA